MTDPNAPSLRRGRTEARWAGGALLVCHGRAGVVVDAPVGVGAALSASELTALTTVVVSGDRLHGLAGLWLLCDAVTRHRHDPGVLHLVHPLQAERPALLGGAWARGWPDGVALDLDGARPGEPLDLPDDVTVTFVPLATAEPAGGGGVHPVAGCGVRITTPDAVIAWAPSARPGSAAARLCAGADLAVVEVGVRPWPSTPHPWRLGPADAIRAAADAEVAWIVGDDGHVVSLGELPN